MGVQGLGTVVTADGGSHEDDDDQTTAVAAHTHKKYQGYLEKCSYSKLNGHKFLLQLSIFPSENIATF